MLVRQPIENVISALFSTLLLMTFAWPVWTTLKPMRHLLDGIDVKMDALQEPIHRRLDEVNLKMDVLKNSIEVFVVLFSFWVAIDELHCSPLDWQFRTALTTFPLYSLSSPIVWKQHRQDRRCQSN